ncbi:MAG: 50S ribosomal protein P1 [Caldisphaeraceae archaeon]|nr:50S ribosomal protein P1 [Caldisphaeraceae archaeon]
MAQEGKAYVHAALALYYAGAQLNEDNLKKVVESLGMQADDARIKMLVASLSEINIEDVLKSASAVVSAPVAAPASAPVEEKKEEEKEEEKEESKEVDIGEGLSGLFGM